MNVRFLPAFGYLATLPLLKSLFASERQNHGGLGDLVFCLDVDRRKAGEGLLSVYRLSQHGTGAVISPEKDQFANRIWFIENECWRVECAMASSKAKHVQQFCALSSYLHDYRPQVRVNVDQPLLRIALDNLPPVPGFSPEPSYEEISKVMRDHAGDTPMQFAMRSFAPFGQAGLMLSGQGALL